MTSAPQPAARRPRVFATPFDAALYYLRQCNPEDLQRLKLYTLHAIQNEMLARRPSPQDKGK